MEKPIQEAINNRVEIAYSLAKNELLEECGNLQWRRLRSCTAEVTETRSFYVLKSYYTVIACIEKETDICYDFLRYVYGYTATSAQHIAKFDHDYGSGKWGATERLTWRSV